MQEDAINQHAQTFLPTICPISCEMGKEYVPLSPNHIANPYAFYAHARQEEPVFYSPLLDMWVVTRHDHVTTILKDYRRFSIGVLKLSLERYTPEAIALVRTSPLSSVASPASVDPPDHTRLRNCISKTLSVQRLASLEPHMCHITNQLIDAFESQGQMDFMTQFSRPYPWLVISHLLGVPEADIPQMKVWVEQVLGLLSADLPAEQQLCCAQGWVALDRYLCDLVEQDRMVPQDTFTGDLFKASEASQAPLSIAEVAIILRDILLGGFTTTSRFLGNCLYHLLDERQYWQAILDNPRLIPAMVEEALRLDPPGVGTVRMTNEAVELGEKTIPKGALIHVLHSSANHDEAVFPDAGTFHPNREKLNRHVAFGYGVHACLGAPLARLEMRIALEQLSQRLPSLRLVPDQELSYTANLLARTLKQLLLAW